jgi:hypothetical protein
MPRPPIDHAHVGLLLLLLLLLLFLYFFDIFCAPRRVKLLKTRNKELLALLEERTSTPQKRGSKAKWGIPENCVSIKLHARGVQ